MQRKAFRIESMLARPRALTPPKRDNTDSFGSEINALREAIARSQRELSELRGLAPLPRMQKDLAAAITGMEEATQKILRSTETIDESARALQASLQNDYNRGLAQEILEQALRIYEACNFQDVAGQRINKAIAALETIEHQVDRLGEIWGKIEHAKPVGKLINGPRIEGDSGHADQIDIDRMFA